MKAEPLPHEIERIARARGAICAILRNQIGHDFTGYKENTLLRRVLRRMQVLQLTNIDSYVELLSTTRDEVMLLFRDLLIGVTSFFRDADAFEALAADRRSPAVRRQGRQRRRPRLGARMRDRAKRSTRWRSFCASTCRR